MRSPAVRRAVAIVAALVVAGIGWLLYDPDPDASLNGRLTNQTNTGIPSGPAPPESTASPTGSDETLPTVSVAELPPEVGQTLERIAAGGPFPYDRDGVTFENRERLLPAHDAGYYHEYTVPTPGSEDRGARRIVTGAAGERYYTDDHYASFARIEP